MPCNSAFPSCTSLPLCFSSSASLWLNVLICAGRWEAHIWVKENGRQMYLGGYETEETAAEAYDVAALKCKGLDVKTNFDKER